MRYSIIVALLAIYLQAYSIYDAKIAKHKELTAQNKKEYISILQSLIAKNNSIAYYMLANSYELGTHTDKDIAKAIKLYQKASQLGYQKATLKIATLQNSQKEYKKVLFGSNDKKEKTIALNQALKIAISNSDKESIKNYINIAKSYNLNIDNSLQKELKEYQPKKPLLERMDEETMKRVKEYVAMLLKTISSSKPIIKNLGYKIKEYTIHQALEPTVAVTVTKIKDSHIDQELAEYLTKSNILKQAIYNALVYANELEPTLKVIDQELKWVKIELGVTIAATNIKITTKDIE
jgi:hypothetical protein